MPALTPEQRTKRIGILCIHFTRNLAYYRTTQRLTGNNHEFWNTINGNCIDMSVLEWCKIFADNRGRHNLQSSF